MKVAVLGALAVAGLALGFAAPQGFGIGGAPTINWTKPTEQHAFLGTLEGLWEVDALLHITPGQPPMKLSGTETVRLACNGLWAQVELELGDKQLGYSARDMLGFDPQFARYNGVHVDVGSMTVAKYEGKLSTDGKTLALSGEGPDPRYKDRIAKLEQVWTFPKKGERTAKFEFLNDEGGKVPWLELTYKFKKKVK